MAPELSLIVPTRSAVVTWALARAGKTNSRVPSARSSERCSCLSFMPFLQSGEPQLVQSHLARDRRESPVFFKRIEPRIHFDRQQLERAILARLCQPVEAEIDVRERELDDGELERRDVAALRQSFEPAQDAERRFALARG